MPVEYWRGKLLAVCASLEHPPLVCLPINCLYCYLKGDMLGYDAKIHNVWMKCASGLLPGQCFLLVQTVVGAARPVPRCAFDFRCFAHNPRNHFLWFRYNSLEPRWHFNVTDNFISVSLGACVYATCPNRVWLEITLPVLFDLKCSSQNVVLRLLIKSAGWFESRDNEGMWNQASKYSTYSTSALEQSFRTIN